MLAGIGVFFAIERPITVAADSSMLSSISGGGLDVMDGDGGGVFFFDFLVLVTSVFCPSGLVGLVIEKSLQRGLGLAQLI